MRSRTWTLLAVGAGLIGLVGPASAQMPSDAAYDGDWSVTLKTSDGHARTASLKILNYAGEWSGSLAGLPKGDKTCKGQRFPLTVNESTTAELQVTVFGSAKSHGCPDLTLHLAPKSKTVLDGTVEEVGGITLARKASPVRKR